MPKFTTAEELYDNIRLIDATKRNWKAEILRLIGQSEPHTLQPLKSIFRMVEELSVKTVALEHDYVDVDFLDEFQHYYCKRFSDIPSKCTRLHFFQNHFTMSELPYLELVNQGYLGFSVVRPTRSYRTGRTVIISPKDDKHSLFTLCKVSFEANLSGNALQVQGMPFMQQDTNVCVCAEAALWMTILYMHKKFGSPCFRPSQITLAATRSLTVGPVRRGLIPEQVLAALRETGYEPLIFSHYDPEITSKIIYAYVESEIPVILLVKVGTEGHAVVVIGHDFHTRAKPLRIWNSNIYWIDRFYLYDDAVGMCVPLFLRKRSVRSYSISQHAAYVVVPVPQDVSMQASDVFDHVDVLKEHINDLIDLFEDSEPFRFTPSELTGLVFRTYLRLSNDFKTGLPPKISEFFRHRYKSLRMPRYIWVTEISKAEHINKPRSQDRKIVGEIIMDSTADQHSEMTSYLAIHLFGRFIVKRPEEDMPYAMYIDPTEMPYSHLVR